MKPFPISRPDFDLSLRRAQQSVFQAKVLEYLAYLHPSAQSVEVVQGDGGLDIIVINKERVYACYAPDPHGSGWKEAKAIAKINKDLTSAKKSLGANLKEWVFIHNHSSSALPNKAATFAMNLRAENQSLRYMDFWGIDQLWENISNDSPKIRRAAYLRAVAAAFQSYQELALDLNYEIGDRAAPNIWDIFIQPACSETHLSPEDIDSDSRRAQPQHPTFDLITRLAQPEYRRTVLLADPGMGKSTLIQSLLAHLATERPIPGAPEFDGLLPVPLILRDLVPLLPQDNPERWTWQGLLDVFHMHYRRGSGSSLLLDVYQGDEPRTEFQRILHESEEVFFLIDGLDEVGGIDRRRHIIRVLQEGFRAARPNARWVITSRLIGYSAAPIDVVSLTLEVDINSEHDGCRLDEICAPIHSGLDQELRQKWAGLIIDDSRGFTDQKFDVRMRKPFGLSLGNGKSDPIRVIGDGLSEAGSVEIHCAFNVARTLYFVPFDNCRQDQFVSRWFRCHSCAAHETGLMREIRQHGHDGVCVIARVPNLLCMMNMLKRSGKPLPDGRHALYREIVKAYNGGIDAVYFRDNPLRPCCPIEPAERTRLLSILGAKMQHTRTEQAKETRRSIHGRFTDGNILISRPELEATLLPVITAMQQSGKIRDTSPAADLLDELLRHISHRSGLLIPRTVDESGHTVFAFSHLSFLEYFAASYVVEKLIDNEKRAERMRRSGSRFDAAAWDAAHPAGPLEVTADNLALWAGEPNWREVLIFVAEIRSENQDDLETLMEDLFPALVEGATFDPNAKDPKMPFYAVELAMKLAQDRQLNLPETTIERWRNDLWFAWATHSRGRQGLGDGGWPIVGDIEYDWPPISIQKVLREHGSKHPEAQCWGLLESQTTMSQSDLELLVKLLPNLEWLTLADDNEITDLTPIAKLTKLKTLDLYGCADLSDLKPLSGLTDLTWLRIAGTQSLNDLSPLVSLTKLDWLDFNTCKGLADVSPLAKLPSLKTLGLAYCREVTDVSALFSAPALKRVEITTCPGIPQDQTNRLQELFPDSRMARRQSGSAMS